MTPSDIIKQVIRKHGLSVELFFGRKRWAEIVAARADAITELSSAGLSNTAVARAVKLDRSTVIYWLSADRRARRAAHYREYNKDRRKPGTQIAAKTTPEQRAHMLKLVAEQRLDEVREIQSSLGLSARYALDLATKHRHGRPGPRSLAARQKRVPKVDLVDQSFAVPPHKHLPLPEPQLRVTPAMLLGDPPPGRSALDRRNAAQLQERVSP